MSEENSSDIGAFLAGFIIGGLVGAAAALILAPQSGQETRSQIASQGSHLREAGTERMHDYRERAEQVAHEGAAKVQDQTRIVLDAGKSRLGHHVEEAAEGLDNSNAPSPSEDDASAAEGDAGETT